MKITLSGLAAIALAATATAVAAEDDPEALFPVDDETGRYTFQEVVSVDGVDASELFRRARSWTENGYRAATEGVTRNVREDASKVVVRGNTTTKWMLDTVRIRHTLTIEAKEGRYRYTMTDFVLQAPGWSTDLEDREKIWPRRKGILKRTAADIEEIIASLKAAMETTSPDASDDW